MALLSSLVWLFIGYCLFAISYGKNKLGGSITDTLVMFAIIPGSFLFFGAVITSMGKDTAGAIVRFLLIGALCYLAIGFACDPETGISEGLIGAVSGAMTSQYFFCYIDRFDINTVAWYFLSLILPFFVAISATYLLTRMRVRYQKRHMISPIDDE